MISGKHTGMIESLNYPNDYPHYAQCSWTIQAYMGNTISYSFTAFDLEDVDGACEYYDYVKVNMGRQSCKVCVIFGSVCALSEL